MTVQAGPSRTASRVARARARIASLVACVPEAVVANADLRERFGAEVDQIVKMTGVETRRVTDTETTTADLCERAARELPSEVLARVDALIFISQTPDYRLPATACALQHRLGLPPGIIAFDVNLGCSGYPYGLWLGSMMIETGAARTVLLLVGDTISKLIDADDRATALLFGDAGTATVLESADEGAIFVLGSDGAGANNLVVPGGCFRTVRPDTRNNNAADRLFMDGSEIFNFTLKAVPQLMREIEQASGISTAQHDYVLFHQANAFMVNHLRKKIKATPDQVPVNIGRFGNTSSASIPLLIASDLASLKDRVARVAMLGFGVGYSWAGASIAMGPLDTLALIEYRSGEGR